MPTISNAQLNVITHRPEDQASVSVTCDIAFTEVEVNAMNLLGLQYTLQCRVINKDVLDDYPVVTYPDITFPRGAVQAERYDRAIFADATPMNNLHERLIGKDKLVAELKLKNTETGEEVTLRTEIVDVDLAVR
jgi:hypothetical protein